MQTATFAELGLSAKVQAAIQAAGYTQPTPIQVQAIPVAVTGRDVLGIAQTGTGKTAGFVLPMLARLESGRARARMPRSLILAPTRELAAQVAQSFEKYGVNHKLTLALLIGGVSFDDQLRKLDRGVDVLIATPGRLLDHFGRGKILLTGVEILVIDEADRMLDMGFIPDIERICKLLPPRRQTLFFSATMPAEIKRLVDTFLKDPVRIEVARPATVIGTITQRFRYCPSTEDWAKREMLRELIALRAGQERHHLLQPQARRGDPARSRCSKHGFNAGALHGDMDQMSRTATLDAFREGRITLLAASDVAARGLDIPDVSHIFNFDVPWQSDDYVHRIGRTGRAGKEGRSLTLVTPDDAKQLKDIERMLGAPVTWIGDPPSAEDLAGGRRGRGRGRGRHERRRRNGSAIARATAAAPVATARRLATDGRMDTPLPSNPACTPSRADPRQPQEARERGTPSRQARPPRARPQPQPREPRSEPACRPPSRARLRRGSGSPSASASTAMATMRRPPSASATTSRPS